MSWWGLRGNPDWDAYFWSVHRTREETLAAGHMQSDVETNMLVEMDIPDEDGERILRINAERTTTTQRARAAHDERVSESSSLLAQEIETADEAWRAASDAMQPLRVK